MAHPLVPVFVYPFYLIFRLIVQFCDQILCMVNGTSTVLRHITKPVLVKKCAQVLTVRWRYKYDVIVQSNRLEDFVLIHERFEYPEYVLRDEVSLYHINKDQAVFVECSSGSSAWDLTRFSFSREEQFRRAKRVVILPIDVANRLSDTIGKPKDKLIFLGNISRCGSTLLCRMLQSTRHYISYVEPGVIGDLLPFVDIEDDPDAARYITTTLTLMCKPSMNNPAIEGHVIKITASDTQVIQSLYKLLPEAHYLFVYRNQVPVLKSLARIVPSMSYTHLISLLGVFSTSYARQVAKYHNRIDDFLTWDPDFESPYRKIFPICLRPVTLFFDFLKQGIPIQAVRYEDLIQDPEGSLRRIFSLCGISRGYIPKALTALDKDAQENSALSGTRLLTLRIPEFTVKDEDQVKSICEHYGIPNVLVEKVYPQTLTFSGDVARKNINR